MSDTTPPGEPHDEIMKRFKRWIQLSETWSETYREPVNIPEIEELKTLDKEFLPIDRRKIIVDAYDVLHSRLKLAESLIEKLPHDPLCPIIGGYGYCDCAKKLIQRETEK